MNAPTNRIVSCDQFLAIMRSGQIGAEAFERSVERVTIHGDVGSVMGNEVSTPTAESELGRTYGIRPLRRRYTKYLCSRVRPMEMGGATRERRIRTHYRRPLLEPVRRLARVGGWAASFRPLRGSGARTFHRAQPNSPAAVASASESHPSASDNRAGWATADSGSPFARRTLLPRRSHSAPAVLLG